MHSIPTLRQKSLLLYRRRVFIPRWHIIVRKISLRIRNEIVEELNKRLLARSANQLDGNQSSVNARIMYLQHFNVNKHCFYTFMSKNAFSIFKLRDQSRAHDVITIEPLKQEARKLLYCTDPQHIAKSEKVTVLYRLFPSTVELFASRIMHRLTNECKIGWCQLVDKLTSTEVQSGMLLSWELTFGRKLLQQKISSFFWN